MPRIKIFNALEIEAFDSPPVFNSAERKKFFTLPMHLRKLLSHSLYSPINQVCFTLTAGYFRARHKFFGKHFLPADLSFVTTRLGVNEEDIKIASYNKQTLARHQKMLLDFFGYHRFDAKARDLLIREIAELVSTHVGPKVILLEAIEFLIQHRVALPGYSTLADLIGDEINRHKRSLIEIVNSHLTDAQRQNLDLLLVKEAGANGEPSQVQRSHLTLLKKFHQSTKPSRIKENLADWQRLSGLYSEVESVIMALGLSPQGLSYYAQAVIKAEIFQVTRR